MLKLEATLMAINAVLSLFIGQLYEVWGRKKVLVLSVVLMAVAVIIPAWAPDDNPKSHLYTVSLLSTGVMSGVIMQNPLLNDYVKKHKRGCGAALQEYGKQFGEIIAFAAFYSDYYLTDDGEKVIFYTVGGGILVIGLLVAFVLVREPEIKRDYKKDKDGKLTRTTKEDEKRQEEEDKNFAEEGVEFFKDVATTGAQKVKIVTKQTWAALTGADAMIWLVLYSTFVHKMLAAQAGYIIYLWTVKWVIADDVPKTNET